MIDGTPALQISNETVPDLAIAKNELDNIFFLIFHLTLFHNFLNWIQIKIDLQDI